MKHHQGKGLRMKKNMHYVWPTKKTNEEQYQYEI